MRLLSDLIAKRYRPVANRVALALILAYVILAAIGQTLLLTPHTAPPILNAITTAVLMSSVGALVGGVGYAVLQARRRLRLEPSGMVLGGVAGILTVTAVAGAVRWYLISLGNEGGGMGYMMTLMWGAICVLAFELSVVLLLAWGAASVAMRIREGLKCRNAKNPVSAGRRS